MLESRKLIGGVSQHVHCDIMSEFIIDKKPKKLSNKVAVPRFLGNRLSNLKEDKTYGN